MILEELMERLETLTKEGCSKFEIDLMQEGIMDENGNTTIQLQSRIKDLAVSRQKIILIGKELE